MATKETIITVSMMILITYTLSLSLVSQAFPAGQATAKFSNTGSIQIQASAGIGVYSNYQCTSPLTNLPWGDLAPGGSSSITCYVKNEGNTATTLSLVVDNWSSTAAETYIDVDWDYTGTSLDPDAMVTVTLSLSVSPDIVGVDSFSFDITIVAST